MKKSVLASSLLFALLAPDLLTAQEIPSEFPAAERIVAIGDVHGAYDRFVKTLQMTGVVDNELRWIAGATHLVQTGDVLDRGPDSRKAMDLLMELEPQAEAQGGRVHALIGNHEFWNVVGELGYVSAKEFEAFDGARDEMLRQLSPSDAAKRRPGYFAHRAAFQADGDYGRWIRRHNAVVKIGDIVFVHGAITAETARLGLSEINREIRRLLDAEHSTGDCLAHRDEGPLLSRLFSEETLELEEQAERVPELVEALELMNASTLVMGHSVTFGLIEPRFDGRAILIDTGMLDGYVGGREAALVIEGDRRIASYPNGQMELPPDLSGDAGSRYVVQARQAAPKDRALARRLAQARVREGNFKEASKLYDSLNVTDARTKLPLHWRKEAAEVEQALHNSKKAAELLDLYLSGLKLQAEAMGPPFLDAFARECLRVGLRIDEAYAAARKASSKARRNLTYRTTLAWAYLEQGDPERASRILQGVIRQGGDEFLSQFLLGRSYAELDERDKALDAFQSALKHRPGSTNVEKALAELDEPAK